MEATDQHFIAQPGVQVSSTPSPNGARNGPRNGPFPSAGSLDPVYQLGVGVGQVTQAL